MKKILMILLIFIPLPAMAWGGFGQSNGFAQNNYHSGLQAQNVVLGRVVAARPITAQGRSSGVGSVAGAVVGGALGSQAGEGLGKTAATVVGAIFGGMIGHHVSSNLSRHVAYDVTVRLMSNGRLIAVAQDRYLSPGTQVQVVFGGNKVRVFPY